MRNVQLQGWRVLISLERPCLKQTQKRCDHNVGEFAIMRKMKLRKKEKSAREGETDAFEGCHTSCSCCGMEGERWPDARY